MLSNGGMDPYRSPYIIQSPDRVGKPFDCTGVRGDWGGQQSLSVHGLHGLVGTRKPCVTFLAMPTIILMQPWGCLSLGPAGGVGFRVAGLGFKGFRA